MHGLRTLKTVALLDNGKIVKVHPQRFIVGVGM